MSTISVVIPTYKKVHQLIENLEINLHWLHSDEVIVVNDDPTTSIVQELTRFPHVTLIENTVNQGFAGAVNTGIRRASCRYVMLLNSDVVLKDERFRNAQKHFEHNDVFAVSFAQQEKNGTIVGRNRIYWHNGFFMHEGVAAGSSVVENGWAEGGSALFDSEKLKQIGSFDTMYSPFYWEDIDLSYRAWKAGYRILFDPAIEVEHHHESTIGSYFSKNMIRRIAYRNQLLFIKKNITDKRMIAAHRRALPGMVVRTLLKGDYAFLLAFLSAMKYSISGTKTTQRTDSDVLSRFQ